MQVQVLSGACPSYLVDVSHLQLRNKVDCLVIQVIIRLITLYLVQVQNTKQFGPLLQLVEEVPHKHSVVGSSPTWSTRKT